MRRSELTASYVRYFLLPASKERQAEIIEVLNSDSTIVQVPMREEDIELAAFYERSLTSEEVEFCKGSQTWKVFDTWEELQQDHKEHNVAEDALIALLNCIEKLVLEEGVVS